jgi:hypothetical protein
MGKPLTIQNEDDRRLLSLKRPLGAKSKVEVLRRGLDLLERELSRQDRVKRWKRAAELVAAQSARVHRNFQKQSRLKKIKF